jgi:YHS domain-containing protein
MEILARILRFLFWLVVLSWSISLLKRLFGGQSRASNSSEHERGVDEIPSGKKLVRDPVCGMHVAEELAIAAQSGNELIHFCSTDCRDRYMRQTQKFVANG